MAQIKMKLYTDKKCISNNNEKFKIYDAAGTFISDKAVLTCGHCICHESDASPEMPFPYSCGTENPSGEMQENLNVKCRKIRLVIQYVRLSANQTFPKRMLSVSHREKHETA